ncbi:hypothetical protein VNO77_23086 [Canavalia gladiata]|uniref:Uncharacterized protein n=1 Tax=Canavalia gladiata TaxID=3824 RepID=A0AAN9L757_CANGL
MPSQDRAYHLLTLTCPLLLKPNIKEELKYFPYICQVKGQCPSPKHRLSRLDSTRSWRHSFPRMPNPSSIGCISRGATGAQNWGVLTLVQKGVNLRGTLMAHIGLSWLLRHLHGHSKGGSGCHANQVPIID